MAHSSKLWPFFFFFFCSACGVPPVPFYWHDDCPPSTPHAAPGAYSCENNAPTPVDPRRGWAMAGCDPSNVNSICAVSKGGLRGSCTSVSITGLIIGSCVMGQIYAGARALSGMPHGVK